MPEQFSFSPWIPEEIKAWARSLHLTRSNLTQDSDKILARLMSSRGFGITRSGKAFIGRFRQQSEWHSKLTSLLLAVAKLPLPSDGSHLTPSEAQQTIERAIHSAVQLANAFDAHPELFRRAYVDLGASPDDRVLLAESPLSAQLRTFAQTTREDLEFSLNHGGPLIGRNDGQNAELNDYIRRFSIAAQENLGDLYASFCSRCISIIVDRDIPESTYRLHALNITPFLEDTAT